MSKNILRGNFEMPSTRSMKSTCAICKLILLKPKKLKFFIFLIWIIQYAHCIPDSSINPQRRACYRCWSTMCNRHIRSITVKNSKLLKYDNLDDAFKYSINDQFLHFITLTECERGSGYIYEVVNLHWLRLRH